MKSPGLQELYLNAVRREKIPTTFFLVNGFQMKGTIQAFDSFTVVLQCGGRQQMLFKHAISTIIPDSPVSIGVLPDKEDMPN